MEYRNTKETKVVKSIDNGKSRGSKSRGSDWLKKHHGKMKVFLMVNGVCLMLNF